MPSHIKPIVSIGVFLAFLALISVLVATESDWPVVAREPKALRDVHDLGRVFNRALFSHRNLAPTYPKASVVKKARTNGVAGMGGSSSVEGYYFRISSPSGDTAKDIKITLEDLQKLPKQDLVFNFKCIEGWSQITWWGGVRFADVVKAYGLASKNGQPVVEGDEDQAYRYVGMESIDKGYYVGIDMPSAMHPQTLLVWEMNGEPLPAKQGAPLRLIIPVKYGVKSIMKIGRVFFQDERPRDYWYERGYEYELSL